MIAPTGRVEDVISIDTFARVQLNALRVSGIDVVPKNGKFAVAKRAPEVFHRD